MTAPQGFLRFHIKKKKKTALEGINWSGTFNRCRERVPKRWSGIRKAASAKPSQTASWYFEEIFGRWSHGLIEVCRDNSWEIYTGAYHGELYKWAAAPCIRLFAQQAASTGLSALERYDRICSARTTSGRHCSCRVVAGIYCSLLCYKGYCCNNPGVVL